MRFVACLLLLAIGLVAQPTVATSSSIYTPQVIPSPTGAADGVALLTGWYAPSEGLVFELIGIPDGYGGPATGESIAFFIEPIWTSPSTPVDIFGADYWLNLTPGAPAPLVHNAGAARNLGPADTTPYVGRVDIFQPVIVPGRRGADFRAPVGMGGLGQLQMQAFMLDPSTSRLFSSNVLRFIL